MPHEPGLLTLNLLNMVSKFPSLFKGTKKSFVIFLFKMKDMASGKPHGASCHPLADSNCHVLSTAST